jgi:hypothetical protein
LHVKYLLLLVLQLDHCCILSKTLPHELLLRSAQVGRLSLMLDSLSYLGSLLVVDCLACIYYNAT